MPTGHHNSPKPKRLIPKSAEELEKKVIREGFGGSQPGAGPPEKPIDWEQFEKLCGLQCTQSEIASMFKVDEDTIRDRVSKHYKEDYSVIYKRYSESGKCSLRRNQFKLTENNASMGIWLGKQWLDQKDTTEVSVSPETGKQFVDVMKQLTDAQLKRTYNEPSN